MAYGLILKTTITIIINVLLKMLIINPPWPFGPTALFDFGSAPTFLTSWVHVPVTLPCFPTFSSLSHTFPHHEIHFSHHLRHGLNLDLCSTSGGRVLIWHDSTCKNWLVVKNNSSPCSCFDQTLLISSHAHTSRLIFLRFLRNSNQHQIEPTSSAIQICIYESRRNKNQKTTKNKTVKTRMKTGTKYAKWWKKWKQQKESKF